MKATAYKTETFMTGHEDFMIDIVEHTVEFKTGSEKIRDVWLYRQDVGIKTYVIGELETYWKGQSVPTFAKLTCDYLKQYIFNDGSNWYEYYDEEYCKI